MEEIDFVKMEHLECGGIVFELESHADNERVFWCMNCGGEIHVLVED